MNCGSESRGATGGEGLARRLADRYDREARAYRELWAPVLRQAALGLVRALAGERVDRVLDVGTGVGSLLPDLRAAFPAALVLGVDRSRGMIALAPSDAPRGVMDAMHLAIATASVDRVLLAFMLFHLDLPSAGLCEARRVLRPGGRVGTVTWNTDFESKATRVWVECLDEFGAAAPDTATETRHDSVDTPEKMEALLRDAGFTSARAWIAEISSVIDAAHLVRLRTSMGSSKPRFESLDSTSREACVAEVLRRMRFLAPEDFMARGKVVYAVGQA